MKWEKCGEADGAHEIASGRGPWSSPGVSISYGQRVGGGWIVRLDMHGDSFRLSDPFSDRADCERAARQLAQALYNLWPPEPV